MLHPAQLLLRVGRLVPQLPSAPRPVPGTKAAGRTGSETSRTGSGKERGLPRGDWVSSYVTDFLFVFNCLSARTNFFLPERRLGDFFPQITQPASRAHVVGTNLKRWSSGLIRIFIASPHHPWGARTRFVPDRALRGPIST